MFICILHSLRSFTVACEQNTENVFLRDLFWTYRLDSHRTWAKNDKENAICPNILGAFVRGS